MTTATRCRRCTHVDAAVDLWHWAMATATSHVERWDAARAVDRYEKLAAIAKKARERGRHFHILETL